MAITKLKSNLQFKLWLHPIKNKKLDRNIENGFIYTFYKSAKGKWENHRGL